MLGQAIIILIRLSFQSQIIPFLPSWSSPQVSHSPTHLHHITPHILYRSFPSPSYNLVLRWSLTHPLSQSRRSLSPSQIATPLSSSLWINFETVTPLFSATLIIRGRWRDWQEVSVVASGLSKCILRRLFRIVEWVKVAGKRVQHLIVWGFQFGAMTWWEERGGD